MSDDIDDYDDIFDDIKKFFKLDSNIFDLDFIFFPESGFNKDFNKIDEKGFKVSYHFEKGMEKPDIKIEGDIDVKKLRENLEKYNLDQNSKFKKFTNAKRFNENVIDAKELSLKPQRRIESTGTREPYTEINDFEDFTELVLEVPGIDQEDIILEFSEEGRKLTFRAHNENRNYLKQIYLPFRSSLNNCTFEINNGILIIKAHQR